MKMKYVLLPILPVIIAVTAFAQDRAECERIAGVVFEAIGKQDMEQIKPYLSEQFEISGQVSPVAERVLALLLDNLGNVKSFTLAEAKADSCLTLSYDVEYEKHGKKEASFCFDGNGRIRRMELLRIQVKTATYDPSAIKYNPSNVIEIPFTMMESLITVKASIDGIERDFILDSGSGVTLINSSYIGKDTASTEEGKTVLSSAKGVHNESLSGTDIVKASIDFYGISVEGRDMVAHDISHLERDGRAIYGLIGHDFLEKYDVLYDYGRKVITLINPDYFETYRKEKFAGHSIETIPLEWRGHIPVIQINIGNEYYKMGIDCGAGMNLMSIDFFPDMKGLLRKISSIGLGGASKGKKEVPHARLKKFYAGATVYKNTQFVFSDISHLNSDKEVKIDGLLGYDFLSKRPTLLSHARKELLLVK